MTKSKHIRDEIRDRRPVNKNVEPLEEVLPIEAIGFERVVCLNKNTFTLERADCGDFNIIFVLSKAEEEWLVEKFAGLYMIKGPHFAPEIAQGNIEIAKHLYIEHIASRNFVGRLNLSTTHQLRNRVNFVEYAQNVLRPRGLLKESGLILPAGVNLQ